MSIQIKILTWWRGQFVGQDDYGNKYYQDKKARRDGKVLRWVIYNGIPEATKVPPEWHGWLHYTTNDIPENTKPYIWQKPHQRNLTGTSFAYKPKRWSQKKDMAGYVPWLPK